MSPETDESASRSETDESASRSETDESASPPRARNAPETRASNSETRARNARRGESRQALPDDEGAGRPPHAAGVLLIDKARGPTSFDVVAEIRRRYSERRVGHTGTLDPMATGLLPVCLGEACKLVPFLTGCDKRYEAEVVFGVGTKTGDAEGEVNDRRDDSALDPAAVDAADAAFGRHDPAGAADLLGDPRGWNAPP